MTCLAARVRIDRKCDAEEDPRKPHGNHWSRNKQYLAGFEGTWLALGARLSRGRLQFEDVAAKVRYKFFELRNTRVHMHLFFDRFCVDGSMTSLPSDSARTS